MKVIPKIKFEIMTMEETAGILEWAILIDEGPLKISEHVFKMYPELNGKKWATLSREERIKKIKVLIFDTYTKNVNMYEKIINEYENIWNKYNNLFMNNLSEVLNIEWNNQFNQILVKVGKIPIYPRDLEEKSFYISEMKKDELIETIMHECCHFLYFEKWKQLFKKWKQEDFDSPNIVWYLSEMLVDPILNDRRIQEIIEIRFRAYESFYTIEVNGNNLMNTIKDIYNKNTIEKAIIKCYDLVCKNQNVIKK